MTISVEELELIEEGSSISPRKPTELERIWLVLFDDLFSIDAEEMEKFTKYYEGEQDIVWNVDRFKSVFGTEMPQLQDNWCEVVVDSVADRLAVMAFTATEITEEDLDTENATDKPDKPSTPQLPQQPKLPQRNGPPQKDDAEEEVIPGKPVRPHDFGETPPVEKPHLRKLERKAQAIWERNRMDAIQHQIYTNALVKGRSFVIVWPSADDEKIAKIFFNDAALIRVWYDENGEIEAAAKQWQRVDGKVRRNLYFPDRIEKWMLDAFSNSPDVTVAAKPKVGQSGMAKTLDWVRFNDEGDESWPIVNKYDRVPVFPFINKPHTSLEGQSEIKNTIPQQDAINKQLGDMLVASEYGAFKQKIIASKGRPTDGWKHGPNQLWSTTDTDAKWGDFDATELENFLKAIEMWVQHVAGTSRTPQHFFFVTGQPPSGEALKTAEAGLVAKTNKKTMYFGNTWEDAIRFAIEIEMGSDVFPDELRITATWDDTETRIESDFWDIQTKKKGLGVPNRQLLKEGGYSEEEIAEFEAVDELQTEKDIGNALLRSFESGTGAGGQIPPEAPKSILDDLGADAGPGPIR